MRVLLHICCAPDATTPYLRLGEHEVTCLFYNPNIDDSREYKLRLKEAEKLSSLWGIELVAPRHGFERWRSRVEGLEEEPEGGKRCLACYRLRLEETAKLARRRGYDAFATTLTISPHKQAEKINATGEELAKKYGIAYLASNFKKKDGFKESVEWSRKLGLHRQSFCGCSFSRRESLKRKESTTHD